MPGPGRLAGDLLAFAGVDPVPLPGAPAGPLHFPSPPSCAWLLVWALLVAGLVVWLGRLLWRRLRRYLDSRPPRPVRAAAPQTGRRGILSAIAAILDRHQQSESYRQGCHELSGALRQHWEQSGLVKPAGPRFSRMTAREIEDWVGDRPATRLLSLLSQLQFGRREPSRGDFQGACKLAIEQVVERVRR